ncbi:MAG: NifB/NifX family molybdenum-iron cluster-binding protein [Candidatus Bathyarchaeia archaeon]
MKVVVPVDEDRGMDSRLSEHFGRAPFFAVFDLDESGQVLRQEMVRNEGEHFGGAGRPAERLLQLRPDVVITYGMGPRALGIFQQAKVAVMRANSNILKEVISSYLKDELEEFTESCQHARHHY